MQHNTDGYCDRVVFALFLANLQDFAYIYGLVHFYVCACVYVFHCMLQSWAHLSVCVYIFLYMIQSLAQIKNKK